MSVRSASDGRAPGRETVAELRERLVSVADASHMEQQAHIAGISDLALRQAHLARQGCANETRV